MMSPSRGLGREAQTNRLPAVRNHFASETWGTIDPMDDIQRGLHRLRQGTDYLFDRETQARRKIADQLLQALDALGSVKGFFLNESAKSAARASIQQAFEVLRDDSAFRSAINEINEGLAAYASSISRNANEEVRRTVDEIRHRVEDEQKGMLARNKELQGRLEDVMRMLDQERRIRETIPAPSSEELTIQSSLLFVSAAAAGDSLSVPRFVPYEVYVRSDDYQLARAVHDSFLELLSGQGFEPLPSLPVVVSSQRIRGVVKTEPMTQEQLERLLAIQEGILQRLAETTAVPAPAPRTVALPANRKEDAEISKLLAETDKIRLETGRADVERQKIRNEALKAGSEAGKNILEAFEKLSSLVLKAGVGISLLFGHVSISNAPKVDAPVPAACAQGIVVKPLSREDEIKMLEDYLKKLKAQETSRGPGGSMANSR